MTDVQCPAKLNSIATRGAERCRIRSKDFQGRHFGDHVTLSGDTWTNHNALLEDVKSNTHCQAEYRNGGPIAFRCQVDARRTDRRHFGDHVSGRTWWINVDSLDQPIGLASSILKEVTLEPVAQDSQVGGDHYRKFKIQPWDIWEEYGLDAFTGAVIKYLLRAGHKGSKLEDLRKARHTLDRLIEIEEAKEG